MKVPERRRAVPTSFECSKVTRGHAPVRIPRAVQRHRGPLREALTQATQSTWPTFAGFQAHSADWQFAPQDSDAAAADWFRFYRAYFVRGIETMTDADADAEIARRVGRAANAAEDGWLQTVVACDDLSRWQDQVWDDAQAVFALWHAQSAASADASPEI